MVFPIGAGPESVRLGIPSLTKVELEFIFQGNKLKTHDVDSWIDLAFAYPGRNLTLEEVGGIDCADLDQANQFNRNLNVVKTMRWLNECSDKGTSLHDHIENIPIARAGSRENISEFCISSIRRATGKVVGVKDIYTLSTSHPDSIDPYVRQYIENNEHTIEHEILKPQEWRGIAERQMEAVTRALDMIQKLQNNAEKAEVQTALNLINDEILRYSCELTGLRDAISRGG